MPVFGRLLEYLAAAFRAFAGHFYSYRLCKSTVRKTGTGKKSAESAHAVYHLSSANFTELITQFIGNLYSLSFEVVLGGLHLVIETGIEPGDNIFPVFIAVFYLIQILFHLARKLEIDYIRKIVLHH